MKFVRKTRMKVQRSIKTSSVLLFISWQIYSGPLIFPSTSTIISKAQCNIIHRHFQFGGKDWYTAVTLSEV